VLAEEGGFLAAVLLLGLYALLFWRLVAMAAECPAERDQLVIVGVLVFVGFQVLLNVGVTLGLAPVTGITLPLVSYGGTSLLSTLAGAGRRVRGASRPLRRLVGWDACASAPVGHPRCPSCRWASWRANWSRLIVSRSRSTSSSSRVNWPLWPFVVAMPLLLLAVLYLGAALLDRARQLRQVARWSGSSRRRGGLDRGREAALDAVGDPARGRLAALESVVEGAAAGSSSDSASACGRSMSTSDPAEEAQRSRLEAVTARIGRGARRAGGRRRRGRGRAAARPAPGAR
jgi:hypothetical protein